MPHPRHRADRASKPNDPFLRRLLWLCVGAMACSALPPSLVRLTWLGYPLICLQLLVGLSEHPGWSSTWAKRIYQGLGIGSMVALIAWVFHPRSLLITGLPLLVLFLIFIGWSVYFAFVSLTTVGYGDIAPIEPLARLASVALSVLGPFYIAVVLGVVVSRWINEGMPPQRWAAQG